MADAAPTALTEAFKKVVGDPANPAGLTPAGGATYATPAGSRPAGDVINVSQAPGLMYTPAEQWAHESDLARQAQNTLEQNRQYDLSKAKFDYDKQQQQWQNDAAMNQALALRQSMRRPMTLSTYPGYGGGGGGGGVYLPPTIASTNPQFYGAHGGNYGPLAQGGTLPNQYTGEYAFNMPGSQSQYMMPPSNLKGGQLGWWGEAKQKQASEENRPPPIILSRSGTM